MQAQVSIQQKSNNNKAEDGNDCMWRSLIDIQLLCTIAINAFLGVLHAIGHFFNHSKFCIVPEINEQNSKNNKCLKNYRKKNFKKITVFNLQHQKRREIYVLSTAVQTDHFIVIELAAVVWFAFKTKSQVILFVFFCFFKYIPSGSTFFEMCNELNLKSFAAHRTMYFSGCIFHLLNIYIFW